MRNERQGLKTRVFPDPRPVLAVVSPAPPPPAPPALTPTPLVATPGSAEQIANGLMALGTPYPLAGFMAESFAISSDMDLSDNPVTATGGETQTLGDWMAAVQAAPTAFTGNSAQALRLDQDVDHRIEIIKNDDSPLNYEGTRAGLVYQHRDTLPGAQQVTIPMWSILNTITGDGYVTAAADSSETVWAGPYSFVRKYGDGSAHAWTAGGELQAYGVGTYNELGLFQGEATNLGSLHGTISGVEVLVKDGTSGTNFDTRMSAVNGRVARWNGGSRQNSCFLASSEGDEDIDAVLLINATGTQPFKKGVDLREGTFSGHSFIATGFSVDPDGDVAAKTVAIGAPSGLAVDPDYFIVAHGQTWSLAASTSTGSLYFRNYTGGTFPFVMTPGGAVTVTGSVSDPIGRLQSVPRSTTAALAAVGNAINTANKFAGKVIINTTAGTIVTANGAAAADVWLALNGTTAHAPV